MLLKTSKIYKGIWTSDYDLFNGMLMSILIEQQSRLKELSISITTTENSKRNIRQNTSEWFDKNL